MCFCQVYTLFWFLSVQSIHLQKDVHVIHRSADILLPCFIPGLCFCFGFRALVDVLSLKLWRQWYRLCGCVCVCYSPSRLCVSFWPVRSLQQPSPGRATRSTDTSWWKTWVTRFMAIRAADENGKARGRLEKKWTPPCFFLFLFKQEAGDEEYRYVRRQRKREYKNKHPGPLPLSSDPQQPSWVWGKTRATRKDFHLGHQDDSTQPNHSNEL